MSIRPFDILINILKTVSHGGAERNSREIQLKSCTNFSCTLMQMPKIAPVDSSYFIYYIFVFLCIYSPHLRAKLFAFLD